MEITDTRCPIHGGRMLRVTHGPDMCPTGLALAEVWRERAAQYARYGANEELTDGTGPQVEWAAPGLRVPAPQLESMLRAGYEAHEAATGAPTWRHVLLEEVAEALQETDPARLREELVQVAAVAVSWVEKLDARTHPST